ncbi:MAG: hypothetical protein H0W78_09660 [Planctomycetes bacterium]|nr:hypothetical protein [Planctomycetota bacterium]
MVPPVHPLARGTKVVTLQGETEFDNEGEERVTSPGSVGRITGIANERDNGDPGFCYDLEFDDGQWVTRDDFELDDSTRYRVVG